MDLSIYSKALEVYLQEKIKVTEPKNLYKPIEYILNIGGKRMRPLLVLMAVDAFGKNIEKGLGAAMAVEVFHNFTLLHDDIMDDAPLRRGKTTVHEKWDVNTAILSGDAMMIMANQFLEIYEGKTYKELMQLFQKTAIEVCEGQQYDVDFETRNDVTIPEYIKMIKLKTSVLVACALKMGAIIADATKKNADAFYAFGLNLGLAFQLQDDYLDAFGDPETFGKQVGGDIMENKKTYLYLKALENLEGNEHAELYDLFNEEQKNIEVKVKRVKELFVSSGAVLLIKDEIKNYTTLAFSQLKVLNIDEIARKNLLSFGDYLMNRNV